MASAPVKKTDWIIWVDCEMSGLDYNKEEMLEIAIILTDGNLEKIIEGPTHYIKPKTDNIFHSMDDWNKEHHGYYQVFPNDSHRAVSAEPGLVQLVRDHGVEPKYAEENIISFLKNHDVLKGSSPLAGNTVYMDKIFMMKTMPELCEYLHYRLIDVSTIKELAKRWYPIELKLAPKKRGKHRALDDIRESITELKYYRANLFK